MPIIWVHRTHIAFAWLLGNDGYRTLFTPVRFVVKDQKYTLLFYQAENKNTTFVKNGISNNAYFLHDMENIAPYTSKEA